MANNFLSTEVSLSNASETTIISATSNKQIIVGLNCANTGTATLTLDQMILNLLKVFLFHQILR